VQAALFEGLVTFGSDHHTPEAGMAERWDRSEDGLTWTFRLRESKWSDDEPVTAGDFVFAWRRLLDPATGAAYPDALRNLRHVGAYADSIRAQLLADDLAASASFEGRDDDFRFLVRAGRKNLVPRLERLLARAAGWAKQKLEEALVLAKTRNEIHPKDLGFEAVDSRTLRLSLERPAPWLLDSLGFMALFPVPEKRVRALGARWADPRIVVTNGPYRIEKSEERSMTLARVRGNGPERVVLEWLPPDEALKRFRNREVDWLDGESIPPKELMKVAQEKEFHYFDLWGTWFLRLNASREPFRKREVRRALAHATDRTPLVELVRCNSWSSMVPPGFSGYVGAEGPRFSRASAMEWLLKGYVDVTAIPKIEFLVPEGSRAVAERLQEQWEKILGIEVRILGMRGPAYARALAKGAYDVALAAWVGEAFDPSSFLEPWTREPGVWRNEDFEKLVAAAQTEKDEKRRLEFLSRAERLLIAEECAAIPLWVMGSFHLISARVKGVVPNAFGRVLLRHVAMAR